MESTWKHDPEGTISLVAEHNGELVYLHVKINDFFHADEGSFVKVTSTKGAHFKNFTVQKKDLVLLGPGEPFGY